MFLGGLSEVAGILLAFVLGRISNWQNRAQKAHDRRLDAIEREREEASELAGLTAGFRGVELALRLQDGHLKELAEAVNDLREAQIEDRRQLHSDFQLAMEKVAILEEDNRRQWRSIRALSDRFNRMIKRGIMPEGESECPPNRFQPPG